jgi:hypothetical protein
VLKTEPLGDVVERRDLGERSGSVVETDAPTTMGRSAVSFDRLERGRS